MSPAPGKAKSGLLPGILLFVFALFGIVAAAASSRPITGYSRFPVAVALACGYCALVAIVSAIVNRVDRDAAVGAYRLIGRWFAWGGAALAAFSLSLLATGTAYADDLKHPDKLFAIVAITAPLFVLFAYLLQRAPQADRPPPAQGRSRIKAGLAIVLCLVAAVMLYQRYAEKLAREAGYDARDEAARRAGKPWSHELDAFHGGMSEQEVRALAQTTGHVLKCHVDLRSEERINRDDKSACWVPVGEAWGIPARWTGFAFGDEGLRNQILRFPDSSWPQVEQTLDRMGKRLSQDFGLDPETRRAVYGWRLESGLVLAAAAPRGKELTVQWTAKRAVALEHCAHQGPAARRDPQRLPVPIKELWPEIDCSKLR